MLSHRIKVRVPESVPASGPSSQQEFFEEVLKGLTALEKRIAPKFLYDSYGSNLFEAICQCPEYYVTRSEEELLVQHQDEIAGVIGGGCALYELGAGSGRK